MAISSNDQAASSDVLTQQWLCEQPWLVRALARLGLQGRLIFCFVLMLSLAVGASCWLFARQSTARITEIMGEQARQLSSAFARASEDKIRVGNVRELTRMAQDLVKSRNIVLAAFFDNDFKSIAIASRDPEFRTQELDLEPRQVALRMDVHRASSPVLGDYLQVVTPVVSLSGQQQDQDVVSIGGPRLLGYVVVGVSQASEAAQLQRINYVVVAIGAVLVIVSVPLAFLLVGRAFQPIRRLVDATQRIIGGDLETRVAIHRPDVIGVLARSFNEMVIRVKKQQEDLAQANRDLENKVEQRTAQLAAANKRLSSEIAEKEEFLRAVSHDLNAPLRNIGGMASMLLTKNRGKFDEEIIHRLERIQKNVEAETDLITELLELSRIKTRRQEMVAVNVESLIDELRDVFENDLRSRNIDVTIDTPLPTLVCEKARIRQVFQNLIDNGIKYMGERPVREIRIGCEVRPMEAEFYVRDTGIGIATEEIEKVFYVFRRGKSSAVQSIPGKGVGLASVKSIIETYSGRIWVESRPNEGSTFRFTIHEKYLRANTAEQITVQETEFENSEPAIAHGAS